MATQGLFFVRWRYIAPWCVPPVSVFAVHQKFRTLRSTGDIDDACVSHTQSWIRRWSRINRIIECVCGFNDSGGVEEGGRGRLRSAVLHFAVEGTTNSRPSGVAVPIQRAHPSDSNPQRLEIRPEGLFPKRPRRPCYCEFDGVQQAINPAYHSWRSSA